MNSTSDTLSDCTALLAIPHTPCYMLQYRKQLVSEGIDFRQATVITVLANRRSVVFYNKEINNVTNYRALFMLWNSSGRM